LPSVALGKEKHTVNASFAERQALGKQKHPAKNTLPSVGRSAKDDTRQTINVVILCRVPRHRHSANRRFAERLAKTLGKMYIFFFSILS
jgi:hypothetical protein